MKMTWSIRLALLCSIIFSTQIILSVGQAATPWESVQLAESFIASFLRSIARSSAFSTSQLDDMSNIRKTLTTAMEKFNSSNTTSKIKFQALNMVFASSVAEITAAEEGVNLELKTNAIENALNSACLEALGIINTQFVNDIKNLIYILAHTTANGTSTASVMKVGGYKQRSLRQLEPFSSAEVMRINGFVPQQGSGMEQQRPPTPDSSVALNVSGGPKGSSLQNTSEQRARVSVVAYSQNSSSSEPQVSIPQVPSVQDQRGPSGNRKGVVVAPATGEGLGSAKQSSYISGVNRLQQQGSGDNEQIGQESNSKGKSGVISQRTGSDRPKASTTAASGSYGVGSVALGLQEPSGIGAKELGIQLPSKTENQRPESYETRADAFSAVEEKQPGINAKEPLEEEKSARGSSVAVDKRLDASKSDYYGRSAAASASEGVDGLRPFIGTGGPQENKGPTGKDTKGSFGSRAAIAAATGSYLTSTGAEGHRQEGKDFQKLSRTVSQNEKGMQEHVLPEQILGNQGQYGRIYQKADRLGGQVSGVYSTGADVMKSGGEYVSSSNARVSGGEDPSRQRSSDEGRKVLGTRKQSEVENRPASPEHYGNSMASATTAEEIGYELSNSARRLQEPREQGLSNNGSTTYGRNNYASGRATAIAAAAGEYGPDGLTLPPNISTPNSNSEISSTVSSSVSSSPVNPYALSNVASILSHVRTANPDLPYFNVLIQTLLEIISTLVHLLGSCNIGQFNLRTSNQLALMIGQSVTKDNN